MLKSIQKIKGLGVFSDYTMPAGTQEFGIKNLIYGWNYSGKTTLSRLISLLEHKKPNPDLPNFSFSIATDTGVINEGNFQTSSVVSRVFNSDFIAENINFAGTPFKPILLLGSDSDEAQKKIDAYEKRLERISKGAQAKQKSVSDGKLGMDKAKSERAAAIKTIMSMVRAYGATQFEKDISTVRAHSTKDHELSKSALDAHLNLARTAEKDGPAALSKLTISLNYSQLYKNAKDVLGTKPDLSNTIDYLVQNHDIENWIETGLEIHKDKSNCEFCGHDLDVNRIKAFKEHFSLDLANHKRDIQRLLGMAQTGTYSYSSFKSIEFNAQFREQFEYLDEKIKEAVIIYNMAMSSLAIQLDKKLQAPFEVINLPNLDTTIHQNLWSFLDELNDLIDDNNEISNNFPLEKEAAIDRLKLHYAQQFVKEKKIAEFEKRQLLLAKHEKKYLVCLADVDAEVKRLKAIISQAQRGREEINILIERLLGSDSIQIAVTNVEEEERFQLLRKGGVPANHLSEGEKTAIAFSFFITSLKEIKDFSQAIIYIDDPISSLDSNHIFQVNGIIKETFFTKEMEDENAPVQTKCKQIFLSTHNFEFFSLLRDLKPKKKAQVRYFLVKKISPDISTFGNMPESIYKYSSEYHFLFDVINGFYKAPANEKADLKLLMLLPNAVRRFVELYTYSKYPGDKGMSVDQRADKLFGEERSKRLLKVFHYFSHANNIERMSEQNDLMCDIEGAVDDLMKLLKEKDPLHMEALEASVLVS